MTSPALVFLAFLGTMDGEPWRCPFVPSVDAPTVEEACKIEVREKLYRVFAEFNVDFVTDAEPWEEHATIIFANEGPEGWRDSPPGTLGLSRLTCRHEKTGLSVIFNCQNSTMCALTAAHELGHQLGLAHVENQTDVMFPAYVGAFVFLDEELPTVNGQCRAKQNAHARLKQELGLRSSGKGTD